MRESLRAAEDVRHYRAGVGRDVLGAPPSTPRLFPNLPCEAASSLARRSGGAEPRRVFRGPTGLATRRFTSVGVCGSERRAFYSPRRRPVGGAREKPRSGLLPAASRSSEGACPRKRLTHYQTWQEGARLDGRHLLALTAPPVRTRRRRRRPNTSRSCRPSRARRRRIRSRSCRPAASPRSRKARSSRMFLHSCSPSCLMVVSTLTLMNVCEPSATVRSASPFVASLRYGARSNAVPEM